MARETKDLKSVNEIGKIYNSLIDKKALCDFFPDSVMIFIEASHGFLFLSGRNDQIWLESAAGFPTLDPAPIRDQALGVLKDGKPILKGDAIYVPLIIRNSVIGVASFIKKPEAHAFQQDDLDIAFDLASQMASALKNAILFEQNIEMEKLAAVGKSMGMVLHEIKNIMQLATFAQEWLRIGFEKMSAKHLERGVRGIDKAMRDMNGFVYEILSLTKNYAIQPEKIKMTQLIAELKDDLKEKADQYKVSLDFAVEENFPEVDGEERTLYRALLNLVKNAMEACTKTNACVKVRVGTKDADHYDISVEDNGQGMTEEVKAKLMQAFFSTKGERGTGLGLMIVDRTVKAHHGTLSVDSIFGQGTKFTLTLPKVILPPEGS